MRKKPYKRVVSLVSVKLYRDDIEELLAILNSYSYVIEVSDDKNIYSDLDAMKTILGGRISTLTIEGTAVGTSFSLNISNKSQSKLQVANRDEVFLQVYEFLRARQRLWIGAGMIVGALVLALTVIQLLSDLDFEYRLALMALILCLPTYFSMRWTRGNLSTIYLLEKHAQVSFWTRNKDTVWVGIIVAIVTAVVTWLITYLTTK